MPGGRTRRGPDAAERAGVRGEDRVGDDHALEAVRIRNVEWPMKLTATCPASTVDGGGAMTNAAARRAGHSAALAGAHPAHEVLVNERSRCGHAD